APPRDAHDGRTKDAYRLELRVLDAGGDLLERRELFNPTPITWSNFTAGDLPYRGPSELETRMAAIAPFLGSRRVEDLEESAARHDLPFVAQHAQLSAEDVMRLALAHRVAKQIADAALGPDVFYAFIRQNLPPSLRGDLLLATEGWTL